MFDRQALIELLGELIERISADGGPVRISIVGGAALALGHFHRELTIDIDAMLHPSEAVRSIAASIALEHGLPTGWLNANAAGFLPPAVEEWETVLERDGILIELASAGMLLAMKLNASRPGRDERDIATLLSMLGVDSLEAAEEHFEYFYRGEALPDRAILMVASILRSGLPAAPAPLPPIAW